MLWLTGILGALMIAAPYVAGYTDNTTAMWTSIAIGAGVVLASILAGLDAKRRVWEYSAVVILGVAALVAPFVLNFSNSFEPLWTMVVGGILVAVLAGARMFTLTEPGYG